MTTHYCSPTSASVVWYELLLQPTDHMFVVQHIIMNQIYVLLNIKPRMIENYCLDRQQAWQNVGNVAICTMVNNWKPI